MRSTLVQRNASRLAGTVLSASLLALGSAHAAMATLDFDDVPAGAYGGVADYAAGAFVSDGFVLDPGAADWTPNAQQWIGHYEIANDAGLDNGSNYFLFDYFFDASRLNVYSTTAGGVFGVRQLDLGESASSQCSAGVPPAMRPSACGVTFLGALADGGTVSRSVMLDGLHDGAGALADFETFHFDGRWNRLTMFSIVASHEYLNPALDNLVLRTVPEPIGLALAGLGLAGLAIARATCRCRTG